MPCWERAIPAIAMRSLVETRLHGTAGRGSPLWRLSRDGDDDACFLPWLKPERHPEACAELLDAGTHRARSAGCWQSQRDEWSGQDSRALALALRMAAWHRPPIRTCAAELDTQRTLSALPLPI